MSPKNIAMLTSQNHYRCQRVANKCKQIVIVINVTSTVGATKNNCQHISFRKYTVYTTCNMEFLIMELMLCLCFLGRCSGGHMWTDCGGACTQTCRQGNPSCPSGCVSGCMCPRDQPVLHKGKCITLEQCQSKCKVK